MCLSYYTLWLSSQDVCQVKVTGHSRSLMNICYYHQNLHKGQFHPGQIFLVNFTRKISMQAIPFSCASCEDNGAHCYPCIPWGPDELLYPLRRLETFVLKRFKSFSARTLVRKGGMTDALTCLHVVIFKVLKRQECESRLKRDLLLVGVTICEQALFSWLTEIRGGTW